MPKFKKKNSWALKVFLIIKNHFNNTNNHFNYKKVKNSTKLELCISDTIKYQLQKSDFFVFKSKFFIKF